MNSWKSLEICPAKVCKMEIKSGKMVKSLEFFFSKLQQIYKWFFVLFWSNLIQSQLYDERSFIPAFLKVSVDHIVWKKKLLFWKKRLKKVLSFGSKNLYEPWTKKLMYYSLLSLKIISFVLFPKALMPKPWFQVWILIILKLVY